MLDADRPMDSWLDDVALGSVSGTGAIVFAREGARRGVWATRYAPGAGVAGTNWFPSERLSQGEYNAEWPRVAADPSGNLMVVWSEWDYVKGWAIFASRFDVVTGWSSPRRIDQSFGYSYLPQVSLNSAGVGFATWHVWDGARYNIYANRYDPVTGWGTAVTLDSTTQNAYEPRLGSDDGGNALVTWFEWDGSRYNIMVNRYFSGVTWGGSFTIETSTENAYYPEIGMDSPGNAIIAWTQFDGTRYNVWAQRFDAASSSFFGEVLIEGSTQYVYQQRPSVAMNRDNAVVAWHMFDGTYPSIYANRWVSGTGWVGEVLIESAPGNSFTGGVAIDPAGNAFVTFHNVDTTDPAMAAPRVVRYDTALGWGGGLSLDSIREGVYRVVIDIDGSGNALSAWPYDEDPTEDARSGLRARRYAFGTGWQGPQPAEWDQEFTTTQPFTAGNDRGYVVSAWLQDDGPITNLYAAIYTPGLGWSDPAKVENLDFQSVTEVTVAMDPDGNAIVLYRAYDGMKWAVFATRYFVGMGWGSPQRVDTLPGDVYWLRVAMSAGSGIAVWQQWDGSAWSIFGNLYDTATDSWMASPWSLEPDNNHAYGSHIAMDSVGNAIAVWAQYDGTTYSNFANHYSPTMGWSGRTLIESSALYAGFPQIAMNRKGTAFVSWSWWMGSQYDAAGTYYDPSTGWGPEATFETTPENGFVARPAVDDLGNGMIVWQVWQGSDWDVWAVRGTVGSGWGPPVLLEAQTGDAVDVAVSMDRLGDGFASWTQWNGVNWDIMARRYVRDQGWLSTVRLETLDESAGGSTVVLDGAGNAMATWYQWDQGALLPWAARYVVSDGLPSLSITSPAEGLLTGDPAVTLIGATDIAATVTVDGSPATVQSDGGWSFSTFLPDGQHTFVVVAQNPAGQTRTATRTVTVDTAPPALTIVSPVDGAITNVPNQWVSGFTEPGAGVDIDGITATVDAFGNFGLTEGMVEGVNTFIITATDAAGNSRSASVTVTLDMTAPPLAITSPSPGVTNNPNFIVTGTTEPGASVTVDGAPAFVDPSGLFQYGAITLPEGPHTFQIVSTDPAGNVATASVPVTVDMTGPSIVITGPTNGFVTSASVVSVYGAAEPGATVTVNGVEVSVDASGNFFGRIALAEGLQLIRADATDAAGNTNTAQISGTVDLTPPELSMASPSDGLITNDPDVYVFGFTEPGVTVTIDGTPVVVQPDGTFSRIVTLPDGIHVFNVLATDAAGNFARAIPSVEVDTVAPALAITAPATGTTVSLPTVLVTGTTEPGARVVVNGYAVEVDAGGDFAIRLALANGANAITATATDAAGNVASDATSVSYMDPLPGVWQQLNDTQTDLDTTNAELDETRGRLDATLATLGSTQQTLNATRSDLAATNASLAGLGTQFLLLLVLVIVSLALGAIQFLQLRNLQAQREQGAGPPSDGGGAPPPT